MKLSLAEVRQLTVESLLATGCDQPNAEAVGDTVTAAERDLCQSHGLFRLPGYLKSLRSGKVNGRACPTVEHLTPSVVRVQGDDGFAPLALIIGREPLADGARQYGIAALSLVRTHHFAALWMEVTALAELGLCVFAFTAYKPAVAPAGGTRPIYGTNPMAFAWPREGKPPMVFDQASAAMARGEIMIAARDGHAVPLGVGLDTEGRETTDPNDILKGVQLAFGGYKGASIALMIELLVGPLIGERCSFEAATADNNDGGPPRGGELILAIDPSRFGDPAGYAAHAERLFGKLMEQPGVRLPGDRRYVNRARTREHGVDVPDTLLAEIRELAAL